MLKELEELFAYGNFWLDDETAALYVEAADKVATNPKTAFLLNAAVKEIIDKKNRNELEVVNLLREKFPKSVSLKIIGRYVDIQMIALEKAIK
jgi:hypothetical protein